MESDSNERSKNIFQQFNIGSVGQINNSVGTVTNYYGVSGEAVSPMKKQEKTEQKSPMEQRDIPPIREQIMLFVSCLHTEKFVNPEWISCYMDLWDKILDIPEVKVAVYNPGKQRGTTYNRNLVGNIIHYLGNQDKKEWQVYKDFNATRYTEKLGLDPTHSVRGVLGNQPPVEIKKSLDRFMENYLL